MNSFFLKNVAVFCKKKPKIKPSLLALDQFN